jgi:hypothetical protein
MRVGVLEILALPTRGPAQAAHNFVMAKQYASITPQAISVWCRQRGHQTTYATYHGFGDPLRLLPPDLDVVFVSSYTWASALAYALAKIYRQRGVRTVLGGPHAKAFPADALRFFDLVVTECDATLVADILAGRHDPGTVVSAPRPFDEVPSVEERLPEIRRASFLWGRRPMRLTTVPLLASTGCPYTCQFCIDWNNPYRLLPPDRLRADLAFLARHLPGVLVGFHDPNFAVRFDEVLDVLESIPPGQRSPYMMESSLTNLRGARIRRLSATNCVAVAPGVESWDAYSHKAGVGRQRALDKVGTVAEHFRQLHEHVPYLQANFILGLDTDAGDEPFDLTRAFMAQAPFVWPTLNIPIPFGNTPLHGELLRAGRILAAMPFTFYGSHLVTRLEHYDVVSYYEKLIALVAHSASLPLLRARLASARQAAVKVVHVTRSASNRRWAAAYRRLLDRIRADRALRAFHDGARSELPELYHHLYEQSLGRYAELVSRQDRIPLLEPPPGGAGAEVLGHASPSLIALAGGSGR